MSKEMETGENTLGLDVGNLYQEPIIVPPSWKETAPRLLDSQLITAEMSFSRTLLEKFTEIASDELPQLRSDAYRTGIFEGKEKPKKRRDKKLIAEKAAGLLKAYQILSSGNDEAIDKFREESAHNRILESEMRDMLPGLEKERDKVFLLAKDWNVDDEAREIGKTYNYSENLPKDLKESLQKNMGINPGALRENLRKWGITTAVTFGAVRMETFLATASGFLLNKYTSLENYDMKYLLGFFSASYAGWIYGLGKNIKSNYNALKERGESTRVTSKAAYGLAKVSTESEKIKKIAAATGYILPELQFEAGALLALANSRTSTPEAVVFMSGVNTAGAIYEKLVSGFTEKYLNHKRIKLREKIITHATITHPEDENS